MNINMETAMGTEYIYVVNGAIAEVMARVAYRRVGNYEIESRRIINCPYCTEPLTSVGRYITVKMYRLPKGKQRKPIPGLYVKQCDVCSNKTGVLMT